MQLLSGNASAAAAVKDCNVKVVSAYPITPQSSVVEYISEMVQKKELDAVFVPVESEHSAITVCISASATGSRVFTASSANGLALMHEQLHWAAGARLPIVMCCVNRGMAAPWTIWNDQQDSISQRDTGWIQLYCEDNQEIYDTVIQAYKIAESAYIPVMVCYDGFILSHRGLPVTTEDKKKINDFLPDYKPLINIDPDNPRNILPVVMPDKRKDSSGNFQYGYMEFRKMLSDNLIETTTLIKKTGKLFKEYFGRSYGLFKTYKTDDSEHLIITMGSLGSEAVEAVDSLRSSGIAAGLLNIRCFRPFPAEEIAGVCDNKKNIIIFDKSVSYGYEGPIATETKSAIYSFGQYREKPSVLSVIAGLGGRNVAYKEIIETTLSFIQNKIQPNKIYWLNCSV